MSNPTSGEIFAKEADVIIEGDPSKPVQPRSELPYQHKDTPTTFWERMKMIHGDDVDAPHCGPEGCS